MIETENITKLINNNLSEIDIILVFLLLFNWPDFDVSLACHAGS